jgi:hypothetical protein
MYELYLEYDKNRALTVLTNIRAHLKKFPDKADKYAEYTVK